MNNIEYDKVALSWLSIETNSLKFVRNCRTHSDRVVDLSPISYRLVVVVEGELNDAQQGLWEAKKMNLHVRICRWNIDDKTLSTFIDDVSQRFATVAKRLHR